MIARRYRQLSRLARLIHDQQSYELIVELKQKESYVENVSLIMERLDAASELRHELQSGMYRSALEFRHAASQCEDKIVGVGEKLLVSKSALKSIAGKIIQADREMDRKLESENVEFCLVARLAVWKGSSE